jgi:hypothetical protein
MAHRPRSLKHEYELYIEREIEFYKESVSRSKLLEIGDEAVSVLASQQQLALTELLLCDEVDRLISRRLRLPAYATWRRRRLRALKELSNPLRWGIRPDGELARAVSAVGDGHVVVAGATAEERALYLAANGCAVTALHDSEDAVERVITAAAAVGLTGRLRGVVGDLGSWSPDIPIDVVVCSPGALAGLTGAERSRVIHALQGATLVGGVHFMDADGGLSRSEFEANYSGWQVSVEAGASRETYLARKAVA